jgi:exopolyphosphatase / guanosine-5'-triphosphate,3'-diphosphate pyrophosphatase
VTRVAAIDIGTNTTRLLVAEVVDGQVDELTRLSVVTRLGEGVDARRLLLPASIARVHAALDGFRAEIDALGARHTLAVATSAVRDAGNGPAFLEEIGSRYDFATRLLSGEEEAALTRSGVGAVDEGTLVVDIGGGSTELILGVFRVSLDVGSVRLTERYLRSDPPTRGELEVAAAFVRSLLPELDVTAAIGVAGSVAQLSVLVGELTLDAVETELELLASLPVLERRLVPNLDPGRAPVIVAGTLIIACILRRYRLSKLAYSVRDLLDGVALEAARVREET